MIPKLLCSEMLLRREIERSSRLGANISLKYWNILYLDFSTISCYAECQPENKRDNLEINDKNLH